MLELKTANRHHRTNLRTIADRSVANHWESHRWTHKCRTAAAAGDDAAPVVAAVAADDAEDDDDCYKLAISNPNPD